MPYFAVAVAIVIVVVLGAVVIFVLAFIGMTRKATIALESLDELRDAVCWQGDRLVEVAAAVERFPMTFLEAYERSKRWQKFQAEHAELDEVSN